MLETISQFLLIFATLTLLFISGFLLNYEFEYSCDNEFYRFLWVISLIGWGFGIFVLFYPILF